MSDLSPIINRVENSSLVSIDLEDLYDSRERILYDLKTNLYQDLILREKDFHSFIKSYNWEEFKDKNVAITCTVDAIIPTWAFMILISKIQPPIFFVV